MLDISHFLNNETWVKKRPSEEEIIVIEITSMIRLYHRLLVILVVPIMCVSLIKVISSSLDEYQRSCEEIH